MAKDNEKKSWIDLYYEDVVVGEEVETSAHTMTYADILTFADVTRDHHPLHTDPEFCKSTPFGRPIAHGLYGLALMEGLKSEMRLYEHTSVASLGWDKVRFLKPIFADDSIHVLVRFTDKRESRKPDRGVVTEMVELINQRGEVVTEAQHVTLLLRRREDAPPA
ncbi:MAG: MaoC/PaaZ C-terminal domain-containing protein [Rhodospirillales bacterium]|jgi:acyl dehydratase|nr:MaoC/PaaZ C-terminal domain-containing protein [Rhodospirillales bacterium]MDP7651407.1 MaoC/PaaZ C-terminal domain-containing protein [Rhodospirillales bacterium]